MTSQAFLVFPELFPASSWQEILHNRSAYEIKKALLYQRRENGFQRIIIIVATWNASGMDFDHLMERLNWQTCAAIQVGFDSTSG